MPKNSDFAFGRFALYFARLVVLGLVFSLGFGGILQVHAELRVVASIKPIHSLAAAVMEGLGTPDLLIDGAGSPHGYQLKPSQAAKLQKADFIFWIGPELETFLQKSIETIAAQAKSVPLIAAKDVQTLPPRSGGAIDADDHQHEDIPDKADHSHDGNVDPHIWLDPENAKAFVRAIADSLAGADPDNGAIYRANADKMIARLNRMNDQIEQLVSPVRGRPFVVFHDGYQYFEHRFDIETAASITVNPELQPGAERISEIRTLLQEQHAACVFSEPQFEAKVISIVTEGTDVKTGTLDPLGADLDAGPELYPTLLLQMANAMADCLSKP